jgi:hypothetical protein
MPFSSFVYATTTPIKSWRLQETDFQLNGHGGSSPDEGQFGGIGEKP